MSERSLVQFLVPVCVEASWRRRRGAARGSVWRVKLQVASRVWMCWGGYVDLAIGGRVRVCWQSAELLLFVVLSCRDLTLTYCRVREAHPSRPTLY